jgi:hypothetical protein
MLTKLTEKTGDEGPGAAGGPGGSSPFKEGRAGVDAKVFRPGSRGAKSLRVGFEVRGMY